MRRGGTLIDPTRVRWMTPGHDRPRGLGGNPGGKIVLRLGEGLISIEPVHFAPAGHRAREKGEPMLTSYSVIAPDGQLYGPVDEVGLGQWVREGRVDARTMLHCHATNARVSAASIPSLQPLLGLSPQQVAQLLQPPPTPAAA